MTKKEFIKAIGEKTNMSDSVVSMFLEATIAVIQEALRAGDSVTLPSIGKLMEASRSVSNHSLCGMIKYQVLDGEKYGYWNTISRSTL